MISPTPEQIRERLAAIVSYVSAFSDSNYADDLRFLLSLLDQRDAEIATLKANGAQRIIRCTITGNPCGSDTWAIGQPCDCPN